MKDSIEQKCINKGVKLTDQRKIIAKVMTESDDHPDVDELYKRVSKIDLKISIATVYRTVKLFEEAGIVSKHEIVLAIIGGLFVLETISVIIQVVSFKLTGKRIFQMAPLHHHFEKKGWAESTVVIRFWIISIILALIGLATLKLR